MNAGSDWPSSRALLTLKPSPRRWTLNSTRTIQQTARNCAGQFSILSPGEKCESKKAPRSVVDCYFQLHAVVSWRPDRRLSRCFLLPTSELEARNDRLS